MHESGIEVPPSAVRFAHQAKWLGRVSTALALACSGVTSSASETLIWLSVAAFSLWESLAMEALAIHRNGIPPSKRLLVPRLFEESFRKHFVYTDERCAKRTRANVWYQAAAAGVACFGITMAHGRYLAVCVAVAVLIAVAGIRAPR